MLLTIISIVAASFFITIIGMSKAPYGWQDEFGFHKGKGTDK